ncbi:MAG: alanine racemase [Rikenellaceae bacterium]
MRYLLSEIAKVCGGKLVGGDLAVENILTDSRRSGGDEATLFVAMRGVNHDSHAFVGEMLRRGVNSFMVETAEAATGTGSYIVVENSLAALQKLATFHRQKLSAKVVAIVGSNGKTVVKEWAAQSYVGSAKLFRSPRSYNSQLGVALSLLMAQSDDDIVVIEAGISRTSEMEQLEQMIRPEVVVVTSIGDAHQAGFSSTEEKVSEKLQIAKRAKCVIYHSDYTPLQNYFESHTYNYRLIDAAQQRGGEFSDVTSKRNSQIVEALLEECESEKGYNLNNFSPVAMRLEVKEGLNDSVVVNDSYNSCVNSLSIALDTLNSVAAGRATTLILSPILQSGAEPQELYAQVEKVIKAAGVERVIGVGGQIDRWLKCSYFNSTEELLSKLKREDFASRAILLKGNRSSRFERLAHALERRSHTTRLEVNLDAMVSNLNYFRQKIDAQTKLVAMVKASSYGAGDYEVAQALANEGVDYLAVAFVDEGVALRERGITMPIIVLNADDDSFEPMIQMRLEPEIYSLRSLRQFIEAVKRHGEVNYPIHIKLDTGMHRLGFEREQIEELCTKLKEEGKRVRVASIFSHLSCADESFRVEFTRSQIGLFEELSNIIIEKIGYKPMRHIAASAAIELYPEAQFDAVRLGIGLYGFGVSEENLTPIATLKSRIVQIKKRSAGSQIGYGGAGKVERESLVATIPIGYADGLNRALGCGKWSMLIGGVEAPIISRVCMDSVMIDVSNCAGVEEGDDVVIFSERKGNRAVDMAKILGTIPYEVLTSVSRRVKRVYFKE